MCIETDLLGGFWLFRRWWGLFNRRKGQMKSQYVNIYQAWAVTQDVARKRLKHGYHTVAEPEISDAKRTELDQKARAQTSSTPFFASEQYRMIKKRAMHPNSLIRAGKEGVQLSLL